MSDGAYRVGFRAHQLEVARGIAGRHAFHATVTVTEITGSESFVHLSRDASNWVAVLQGVHEYEPGHVLDAVLDPDNVFVFDAADRLVAATALDHGVPLVTADAELRRLRGLATVW